MILRTSEDSFDVPESIQRFDASAGMFYGFLARPLVSGLRIAITLYFLCALPTYGVLLLVAALSDYPMWQRDSSLSLPFLRDSNIAFTFLVSFPVVCMMLVFEARALTAALCRVMKSGIINMDRAAVDPWVNGWTLAFRRSNRTWQWIGIAVSPVLSWLTLEAAVEAGSKVWMISDRTILPGGYAYIYVIALLYALLAIYVARSLKVAAMLKDLVSRSDVRLVALHADGCCGLRPFGRLGLRNQYVLSVLGLNVTIFIFMTFSNLDLKAWHVALIVLAVVAYCILSPVVFLSPLRPFRICMIKSKEELEDLMAKRTDDIFQELTRGILSAAETRCQMEELERLRRLSELIDTIPVWPLDGRTLKRFSTVFAAPLALTAVAKLVERGVSFVIGGG